MTITTKPSNKNQDQAIESLKNLIEETLDMNKASDIATIDIRDKSSIGDYLIIASGQSTRQVAALADYIIDAVKPRLNYPLHIEGKAGGDWVLVDAGDIIVHIFRPEVREFYNLEKIWSMSTGHREEQRNPVMV